MRFRFNAQSVSLGRVTFRLLQPEVELPQAVDGERRVPLVLEVVNGEPRPVIVLAHEQELQTESSEAHLAAKAQLPLAPKGRARLALTFTIAEDDVPQVLILHWVGRSGRLTLSEVATTEP